MPVVIKELHVKVNVEENSPKQRPMERNRSEHDNSKIIDTCVEKVLQVLKQKERR